MAGKTVMITLTDSAIRELERRASAVGQPGQAVRVGLRPGGCAGTKYLVELTDDQSDDHLVGTQAGLRLLCDPIALTSLRGLKIDFVEALVGGGFRFDNPNVGNSCNCGKSFSTESISGRV